MKSWFAKFRISCALDDGQSLPPRLGRQVARSEELRRYHETAANLNKTLNASAPTAEVPAGLHHSIMRAVRKADNSARPEPAPLRLGWLATSALVLALCFGAWRLANRPAGTGQTPLAAAGTALELTQQVAPGVPAKVVAPLSDEWQRVNQDLENTAEFLLASLPGI